MVKLVEVKPSLLSGESEWFLLEDIDQVLFLLTPSIVINFSAHLCSKDVKIERNSSIILCNLGIVD